MAKTITQSDTPLRLTLTFLVVGAILGLLHFILSLVLGRYVVDPFACGVVGSAAQCASSTIIADGIATVLTATAGLFLSIRYGFARPLLIAITVGLFMWGLTTWTSGLFWLEALVWAVLLYGITYLVVGWMNRYPITGYVIIVSVIAIIIERVVLTF